MMNLFRFLLALILFNSCKESKTPDTPEEKANAQKDTFLKRIEKVQEDSANKRETDLINDSTRNAHD
jgi:hypothetical protein